MLDPELPKDLATLMEWADKAAKLEVWANADTRTWPSRPATMRPSIGLCRTERMFNESERLP